MLAVLRCYTSHCRSYTLRRRRVKALFAPIVFNLLAFSPDIILSDFATFEVHAPRTNIEKAVDSSQLSHLKYVAVLTGRDLMSHLRAFAVGGSLQYLAVKR